MPFECVDFDSDYILDKLGGTKQAKYITGYLVDMDAKFCIIEKPYIDKDYMIDYQLFYSRAFQPHKKFTTRYHFFSHQFTSVEFEEALNHNNLVTIKKIKKSYLGFVVIKPIQDGEGHNLIGRTLLKTYPCDDNKRHYLSMNNPVSLFGIRLNVASIPFQVQDQGVSACATVALWTGLQSLTRIFDIPKLAPAEITEVSTLFPTLDRRFPQSGLTLEQIINCIISTKNLDVEVINIKDSIQSLPDDHVITTSIKSFINMKIPLLAVISLNRPCREPDLHAVVITGYRTNEQGNIEELYVHDDQIGPYSKVEPNGSFHSWENEWKTIEYGGYREVRLEVLFVPIYHKIRESFNKIYAEEYKLILENLENIIHRKAELHSGDLNAEIFLNDIQGYKEELLKNNPEPLDKINILKKFLPRYIWVIRVFFQERPYFDYIYDGTAVHPIVIGTIEFSI